MATPADALVTLVKALKTQLVAALPPTGLTRYFTLSNGSWDQYLTSTDPTLRQTLQDNLQRLGAFTPFFDPQLTWFPNAVCYFDAYAIYVSVNGAPNPLPVQHPEFVLRDMQGNKLFINWKCANGTCPQYAGDFGNAAFVAYQIGQIRQYLAASGATLAGYRGLWLDDVNMVIDAVNGNGQAVPVKDPRTGQAMTAVAWRKYFAEYVEAIRAAFPTIEIVHNSVWYTSRDLPNDPYIRRQHLASDYINIERGFGDTGLTGGTGIWSVFALMSYIDFVHTLGRVVVIEDYLGASLPFSLPCYYMIQTGRDCFGVADIMPPGWPASLKLDLGVATGPRQSSLNGIWSRTFENGVAYACEPGSIGATIVLPQAMFDENGNTVTTISLSARTGYLLRKSLG